MPHGANCRYAVIAYEFQVHKRSGKCSLRFPDDVPTCSCYAQPPTPNPSYSFPACVCVFIDGRSPVVNSFSLPPAAPVISRTFSYSQPRGSVSFEREAFISEAPLRMLKFIRVWALRGVNQMEDVERLDGPLSSGFFERSINGMGVFQRSTEKKP